MCRRSGGDPATLAAPIRTLMVRLIAGGLLLVLASDAQAQTSTAKVRVDFMNSTWTERFSIWQESSNVEGRQVQLTVRVSPVQSAVVPFRLCFSGSAEASTGSATEGEYLIRDADGDKPIQLPASGCIRGDIPAGRNGWSRRMELIDDNEDELEEKIIATISEHPSAPLPAGVAISTENSSTEIRILDDDPTPVTLSRIGAVGAIDENKGQATVEVKLGRTLLSTEQATVPLAISGASQGSHFTLAHSGTGVTLNQSPPYSSQDPGVVFGVGSAQKATIRITAQDNTDTDARILTVGWGSSGPVTSGMRQGGVTLVSGGVDIPIANDDGLPSLNVRAGAPASEGNDATFTISTTPNVMDSAPDADLNIRFTVSEEGGYASQASLGDQTITLPSGTSSKTYTVSTQTDSADKTDGSVSVTLQPVAAGERHRYLVGDGTATVQIVDDDATTVTLAAPSGDISEGGSKTLTVSLSRALISGESVAAPLSFGGGAGFGTDYTLSAPSNLPTGVAWSNLTSSDLTNSPPTVTFTGGAGASSSATVRIVAKTDPHIESSESISATLGTIAANGLGGGANAASGSVSFNLLDATKPNVSVSAPAFVVEGTDARFTFTADKAPISNFTVNFHIGAVGDYVDGSSNRGNKQVEIPAGKTTATWDVPTVADAVDEPRGAITVTVKSGTGYKPMTGATVKAVQIRDDDPTTVTLSLNGAQVMECCGTHYVDLLLTPGRLLEANEELTVPLILSNTTGKPAYRIKLQRSYGNEDTFDSATNTATFREESGVDTQRMTLRLTAVYDGGSNTTDEVLTVNIPTSSASGTPQLGVTNLDGGASGSRTGDGVIRFLDQDVKNTVGVTGGSAVTEGTAASFTVQLDGVPRDDILAKVRLEQQGNFAATSNLNQRSIAFLAGGPSSKTFTVATTNDEDDEAHGHIRAIVVAAPAKYNVAAAPDNEATVTVNDDDNPPAATPVATFSAEIAEVDETAGTTSLKIALSLAAPTALTLNYALSGTATHGPDYLIDSVTGTSGTVSVPKDSTSAVIPLSITNDATAEGDETIIVTLTDGTGYSVGTPGNATLTLVDDEPVVSIAPPGPTAVEGTELAFTVSTRAPVKKDLIVNTEVIQQGDFVPAEDLGDQEVIIKSGDQSAILICPTVNDQLDEDDGMVLVTIKSGSAYVVAASPADSAEVAITDNDDPTSVISISGGAAAVDEGDDASFTVTALPIPTADLTVKLTVTQTGDFAVQGATGDKTVVVGTSGSATYTAATTNDDADEPNGKITATLNDGEGYTVADTPNNAASVTVNDNDDTIPVISISGGAAVTEGDNASFTVTAQPTPDADLTVNLTIAQTGDFAAQGASGTKTVVIGTSGTATYAVATINDETDEANGSITATINAGAGYTVADPPGNDALVAVNDNDEPLPILSISGGAAVAEGDDASFTVTALPAPAANLTVALTVTQTGAFAAQADAGDKTIVVDASGSASYTVATVDDNAAEANGNITATLNNGAGYTVADPPGNAASVAVNDNDTQTGTPEITLSASPNPVGEGSSVTVTASISRALPSAVTVPLVLTAGSAEPGDYGALASIQIAANQTSGAGTITTAQDSDADDETFTVALGTLPGAVTAGTPAQVNLRITDDDAVTLPEVTLSAFPNPVDEGNPVTVTATLSQALASNITIPLALTAGSAETDDYGALASIDIAANQTSGTGVISTVMDDDTDDETFTVALGALPFGVTSGTPSQVNLRMTDLTDVTSIEAPDDEIPASFALEQNYPNPFNPSTTIAFALDKTQRITLSVYDMLGQEVRLLLDGVRPAAHYRVPFDASDLASGPYLYVLRTEEQVAVKTMVLLK